MPLSLSPVPALRLSLALGCPRCRKYNLTRSADPDIVLECPDPRCGYVIWAQIEENDDR
jgi:hypothetical protein